VERLIKAAGNNRHGYRDALMILLTFRHGLRAAEICDLRCEQVS
jgi:type 1 fimbriae regulatory protein FimB/type 1 fimbriae regulatory protein FimE